MSKIVEGQLPQLVPSTRYRGSKRSILPWIWKNIGNLKFETVLDGFAGTGSVSYMLKLMQKDVTFNDVLSSNYQTGLALVENDLVTLNEDDLEFLLHENGFDYPSFIQETFKGIYYLDSENEWLDTMIFNILMLGENYSGKVLRLKRALAFHILFQACLCKRPFNLFHRKNLYMRLADVKRSFGNKRMWDTPFETLFVMFNGEMSGKVFSSGSKCKATCVDIMRLRRRNFDLVYLDPPYTRLGQKRPKNYHSLYHFLEGLVRYHDWRERIDWTTKNRRLILKQTTWDKNSLEENFDHLFSKFQDSIIVLSYGDPGYPSTEEIEELLLQYKSCVKTVKTGYKYKLNAKNGHKMKEVLMIAE